MFSDEDEGEGSDVVVQEASDEEFVPRHNDSDDDDFVPIPRRSSKTHVTSKRDTVASESEEEKAGSPTPAPLPPKTASPRGPAKKTAAKQTKAAPARKATTQVGRKRAQPKVDNPVGGDSDSDAPVAKKSKPARKPAPKAKKPTEKVGGIHVRVDPWFKTHKISTIL